MTDERDPAYRAALAGRYRIVTALDFAEPAALVSAADGRAPDNYLLFEVEKAVAPGARVRIGPLPDPDRELAGTTLPASWRSGAYGARAWSQALRARRAPRRRPGGARDG